MPVSSEQASKNAKSGGGRPRGRPANALTVMSRHKARELAAKNETPLDVMLDNMLWWRHKANKLTNLVEEKIKIINCAETVEQLKDALIEFNKAAVSMVAARDKSQTCAVDAAPYMHPKYTSIAVQHQNREVKIVRLEITNPGGRELIFDADAEPRQSKPEHRPVIDGESTELKSSEAGD
jgi:hypothetical protein